MTETNPLQNLTNAARIAIGVSGIATAIIGILILVWPGHTAMVVAAMFAIYALIAGIVYAAAALFAKGYTTGRRIGNLILAALLIIAGIVALSNLTLTAVTLATLLGIMVGILWILEGIGTLFFHGGTERTIWSVIFGILSIVAGIVLITSPLWGAAVLWLLLGISLVVLGIVQIVHSFAVGR